MQIIQIKNNFFLVKFQQLIKINWGGRIRTYEWRSQSPQPYHLATPQNFEKEYSKLNWKI
jgi:hypothetical protein